MRANDGTQSTDTAVTVNVADVEETPQSVSEPDGEDLPEDTSTTGRVQVGGSATGEIGHADDRDWFAVELEAGKTYRIDTGGVPTGGGTVPSGRLNGVYDPDGNRIPGVNDRALFGLQLGQQPVQWNDGQLFFSPDEGGTYYLAASNGGTTGTGTYTVRVTEIEDDFRATVDTTGSVEVGGTATGALQYETDRDWFAVELTAGETYKVELLGGRGIGGTLPNPYIRGIHDANGFLLAVP